MRTLRSATLLFLLAFASAGCFGAFFNVDVSPKMRDHGVPALATIVDIWDTGWTINENPVIGMHVEVHPDGGTPYAATINRCAISRLAVPQYQPGKIIPVLFDPDDPSVVVVDVERLRH